MEDGEQDEKEDGNAPHAVREHLIGAVGARQLLLLVLFGDDGREVRRNVLVSRIRHDGFEVVAEHVVRKGRLEGVHRGNEFGMRLCFQLVELGKFDGVEERRDDLLPFERDGNVLDKVRDGRILEHRLPLSRGLGRLDRPVHQLLDTRAAQRRNGDDGDTDLAFERGGVDLVARLLHRVHHVEGDDHGNVDLHELRGEIEIALQIGRVDDVDDAVGALIQYVIARDDFLGRVGRERVDAGKVDDERGFRTLLIGTLPLFHRDTRPVAHICRGTRQKVEERRLAAVGIARQCKLLHFATSISTHAASVLRRVSS